MPGLFTAILGDPGAGKTNHLAAKGYLELLEGIRKRVIANFHLKYPKEVGGETVFLSFPEIIDEVNTITIVEESRFYRALILIDEWSENAHAYDFLSRDSREGARFVSQFRKLESYGYYADQRFNKIPKQVRDQTGNFILMEDLDKRDIKKHPPYARDCAGLFQCDYYDGFDPDQELTGRRVFDGRPTRDYYDTREIVQGRERQEAVKAASARRLGVSLPKTRKKSLPKSSSKVLQFPNGSNTLDPTSDDESDEIFTK